MRSFFNTRFDTRHEYKPEWALARSGQGGFRYLTATVFAIACLVTMPGGGVPAARAQSPACTSVDQDCDGIPDAVERELLTQYAPYFRFSRDNGQNETFRPADVRSYLSTAQVDLSGSEGKNVVVQRGSLAPPNQTVLLKLNAKGVSSSLLSNPNKSAYHVNPDNESGRRGAPWPEARAAKRIGLYGHVVPIFLRAAEDYDEGHVTTAADTTGTLFYKIEYWQFFGYSSNDKALDEGDHEADWDTVQLIYQPGNPALRQPGALKTVLFYAHGKQMRFDLKAAVGSPIPISVNGGPGQELRGPDYGKPVPNLHDWGGAEPARNHVLQLYQDKATAQFSHPIVYVEHGGHEFWPSPAWDMIGAQKHGGDDSEDSYAAATPPNLGEVEHPLSEDPMVAVVLQFNGYWGTYSREMKGIFDNNPPPGPPLHCEWTYPVNQPLRPAKGAQEY